ncbi:hypothetical protein EJF18_10193 [Clavispora lusitaniae]|uniref:Uncharacterized protein n=1 Tax=Clavispora lusitaniae TaxID=36911 RepID=A0ACD0WCW5_CLALS|nr:hypothetical protein EJF14_10193 [Clavispora lusitaniae]QFZ31589.1 hypothetical protein EJF16_10193 [Clavispora lusitaniae]QFZ37257.1 hypothetical protein EJF15_10193 [Clavispora lusitaniae]QFZ42941.1 hypothetical protein EJF18_10193 [Clavispora lusitaniae]QFZ48617.1 hypothetical protein EJF17_10193 [Clavispora lusitaniae]
MQESTRKSGIHKFQSSRTRFRSNPTQPAELRKISKGRTCDSTHVHIHPIDRYRATYSHLEVFDLLDLLDLA